MYTYLRAFLLLAIVSTCLGCGAKQYVNEMIGGKDNAEPPSPLVNFIETATINTLWSDDVGKGTDELYIKLVPAFLNNQVFVADTRGNIAALDATTGKTLWQKDTDLPITGGPGADINLLMLGTSEGDVLSLSTDTGEEVWRAKVSSEILSSPIEGNDVAVVRTIDGKIFALDANTGERLWVYDRTVPALTLRGTSTPVIADNIVIAGFDGGRVSALELKTGKLIWETKVAISRGRSELERMVDIDAQPLIIDDVIYVATYQSNITAIGLQSGQILWQRDISSHSELSADAGYLYVTDDDDNVWALDRFSGASVWKQEKLHARQITGPAVLGDKIVVGDVEGYLHWMNKATGDFVARTQVSSAPILVKPIVDNDILFAYASDGTMAAYNYSDKDIKDLPKTTATEEENNPEDRNLTLKKIWDTISGDDGKKDLPKATTDKETAEDQIESNPEATKPTTDKKTAEDQIESNPEANKTTTDKETTEGQTEPNPEATKPTEEENNPEDRNLTLKKIWDTITGGNSK